MTDALYTSVFCTVLKPRDTSVWIVLDGGHRSENIPLSTIHPDDLTEVRAADRVHDRQLRIRSDMARAKGLKNTRNPTAACGDLFGG